MLLRCNVLLSGLLSVFLGVIIYWSYIGVLTGMNPVLSGIALFIFIGILAANIVLIKLNKGKRILLLLFMALMLFSAFFMAKMKLESMQEGVNAIPRRYYSDTTFAD